MGIKIIKLKSKDEIMKFFLDTANVDQIKRINDLGLCDGVTTNPSLIKKKEEILKKS